MKIDPQSVRWARMPELRKKLGGMSDRAIRRLKVAHDWEEGVHFQRISPSCSLYNLDVIEAWLLYRHQPEVYRQIVQQYRADLEALASPKPRRGRPLKPAAA